MEITTHKEVTHEIIMTQEQLTFLVEILRGYKCEIVDRLPDGYGAPANTVGFDNMLAALEQAQRSGER